jgi:hypothetical protein
VQLAVGRGDDAHVHGGVGAIGSDALQLTAFEEAQEEGLHAQAHLADFVEEHGTAMRELEATALVAVGVGEAAAHVAKELRLEQRVGHPRAIDHHERGAAAMTSLVHEASDNFLADTALAGDEHLRIGASRVIQFLLNAANRRARTDQLKRSLHEIPLCRSILRSRTYPDPVAQIVVIAGTKNIRRQPCCFNQKC